MTVYTITDRIEEDMLRQWFADNKEFPLDYTKC